MDLSLFKSTIVRWAVCCLLVCCCLADAASGATKKKPKKKASSSTSASKSDKSSKSGSALASGAMAGTGVEKSSVTVQSGATMRYEFGNGNANTNDFAVVGPEAAGTLLAGNAGTIALSSGSLTKVGTGTLTLSGINSYTGGTTVTNGILINSGAQTSVVSLTSGGVMNVNSAAVLNTFSHSGGSTPDSISLSNTSADLSLSGANIVNLGTITRTDPITFNTAGNPFALSGINGYIYSGPGGQLTNGGVINNTGTLTIPSNLVTTQYFATQNSKPVGYQQTLGHYVQISNLVTTPSSLTLSPASTMIGPVRPGALADSTGSLASVLGLTLSSQTSTTLPAGLVTSGTGSLTLMNAKLMTFGARTLTLNPANSPGLADIQALSTFLSTYSSSTNSDASGTLTLASPQISTVPEPSTMVLAAIGLAGLGALRSRRRRRSPSAAV